MTLFLFVVTALLTFRVWKRFELTDSAVAELTKRVIALENARTIVATPPARAPETTQAGAEVVPAVTSPPPARPERVQKPSDHIAASPRLLQPPPTAVVVPTIVASAERSPSPDHEALESRIGSRWLLYVGVVAIVIGVSYFEKLAIDNHWINETSRVIQGGVAGLLLIAAGLRIANKGYRLYGQLLAGTGVAILYVSTYAAFNFYQLIGYPSAFVFMSAITTVAAWLANSQRSQGLAVVAVAGGFATPFLLPTATDAEAALFGYDSMLIAGTIVMARRRDWPVLNIVSYTFTVLTFLSWAAVFYTPSTYLTTELFLTLFCAMFLYYALRNTYHSTHASARVQRAILWTAPFGYYVISLANLNGHSSALLAYLVILALVGVISGSRTNSWIRLLFWFAVAAPLLEWSDGYGGRSSWLIGGLAAWAGVYVLNLTGLLEAALGDAGAFEDADIALLHVNGLSAYLGAYLLIAPIRAVACAPLAAAFALFNLGLGYLVRRRSREEALHFIALAFTLLTIAIALQFDGAWITNGWATEGVVVTWLGLRERRPWLRAGGLTLFGAAIVRLVGSQVSEPAIGEIVLLNSRGLSGLFVAALTYFLAYLHHRYLDQTKPRIEVAIGLVSAKLLLLAVAASEIVAYWARHIPPPFEPDAQVIGVSFIAGAVIMWLGLRRKEEWVRAIGGAVIAIAAFALFSIQLREAPIGYVAVLNGRAAAGAIGVFVLYGLVATHRRIGEHVAQLSTNMALLTTGASLLTLSLLTSEIDAFWHVFDTRSVAGSASTDPHFAKEMMLSITWAVYATVLVVVGLIRKYAPIRYFAMALFAVTIAKVFAIDLAELDRIYRVLSIIGLGITLLLTSYLYQKLRAEPHN